MLEESPGSIRELARAAGISHVALLHARDGKFDLSREKIRALVAALREYAATCTELADRLADAELGGDDES